MNAHELSSVRYRAPQSAHVESWFLKANEPQGTRAFWTRASIFARPSLPPVAETWAIAFDRRRGHVAVKSTVAFANARFASGALDLEVDGCSLSLDGARGALTSGRGSLEWTVSASPAHASSIVHFPTRALYREGAPTTTKLVTPLSDAQATGSVRVDRGRGEVDTWNVTDWPMMIGHHWGRQHPASYAWTHCNAWNVEGLVFEAITAPLDMGVMTVLATSAFVRWRGRGWDLSRFRSLPKRRGRMSLRRWEMIGEDAGLRVTCEVDAETDDVVGLHYPNPDGSMTYGLATLLARARIDLRLPDGENVSATSRAAALEIGTRQSDHGAQMYL